MECTVGLLYQLAGSVSDHGSSADRWSSRGPVLDGDSQRLDTVPSSTAQRVHVEGRLVFDQRVESPAGRSNDRRRARWRRSELLPLVAWRTDDRRRADAIGAFDGDNQAAGGGDSGRSQAPAL